MKKNVLGSIIALTLASTCVNATPLRASDDKPNVILVFLDDSGFGDISVNGGKFSTPRIDELAKEGINMTSLYASSPVSSPSRAGLLTGRLESRTGMYGLKQPVFFETDKDGLPKTEVTLAKMLKNNGYKTLMLGKWHLGIGAAGTEFIPTRYGFDEWYGIPTSNDMFFSNPEISNTSLMLRSKLGTSPDEIKKIIAEREALTVNKQGWGTQSAFNVPVYHSYSFDNGSYKDEIVGVMQQETFTEDLTNRAVNYIKDNKQNPFFMYIPYPQNHVPLFVSGKFKNNTETAYGDVMKEIDFSMGRIMDEVKKQGIEKNTIIIFTSDNGARYGYEKEGASGSSRPFRGSKNSTYEGGVRVPGIITWQGTIKPGQTKGDMYSLLDMYPTISKFTGSKMPDVKFDGYDISNSLIKGDNSPRTIMPYYYMGKLQAFRSGNWKIHFITSSLAGQVKLSSPELYDLNKDPKEEVNIADQHKDIVEKLTTQANDYHKSLGEWKKPLFDLEL